MDARKFWTMCRVHDWYYQYSDDSEVYRNGRDSEEELYRIATENPDLQTVLAQWREFHFDNGRRPDEPKLDD